MSVFSFSTVTRIVNILFSEHTKKTERESHLSFLSQKLQNRSHRVEQVSMQCRFFKKRLWFSTACQWSCGKVIYTVRKRSLGRGNVFTRVCHSVRGVAGFEDHMTRGDLHPGVSAFRGVAPRGFWADPLPDTWDTTGYGQQAGGNHPTGMLSCSVC